MYFTIAEWGYRSRANLNSSTNIFNGIFLPISNLLFCHTQPTCWTNLLYNSSSMFSCSYSFKYPSQLSLQANKHSPNLCSISSTLSNPSNILTQSFSTSPKKWKPSWNRHSPLSLELLTITLWNLSFVKGLFLIWIIRWRKVGLWLIIWSHQGHFCCRQLIR